MTLRDDVTEAEEGVVLAEERAMDAIDKLDYETPLAGTWKDIYEAMRVLSAAHTALADARVALAVEEALAPTANAKEQRDE